MIKTLLLRNKTSDKLCNKTQRFKYEFTNRQQEVQIATINSTNNLYKYCV